jgi:hypothetical protein
MKYEFDIEEVSNIINNTCRYGVKSKELGIIILDYLNKNKIKEPLKIEVGKLYKNRGQEKCFCVAIKDKKVYYAIEGCNNIFFVKSDQHNSSYFDLISEWEE